jgi:hypothetical protein
MIPAGVAHGATLSASRRPGLVARPRSVFRSSRWDALLVAASALQLAIVAGSLATVLLAGWAWALLAVPAIALSLAWHANTVAHNHLHNPIFTARWVNRLLELSMSLGTGIPQTIWKRRHLWHHAGEPAQRPGQRRKSLGWGWVEIGAILAAVALLGALSPWALLVVWLPGYLLGLGLCQLQGHYEHVGQQPRARGGGISCYARWYNALWFNDGYHLEHHLAPRRHWREHPGHGQLAAAAATSPWPPILRWLSTLAALGRATLAKINLANGHALVALEKAALRSALVRGWLVRCHRRAALRLLAAEGQQAVQAARESRGRLVLVGGGLFPRTLLALAPLFPEARFSLLDGSAESLATARAYLEQQAPALFDRVDFERRRFDAETLRELAGDAERVVVPLGFVGDRGALFRGAPAGARLWVHDWIWRRRGVNTARVSLLLLKRLSAARSDG